MTPTPWWSTAVSRDTTAAIGALIVEDTVLNLLSVASIAATLVIAASMELVLLVLYWIERT